MNFEELNLAAAILKAVREEGYETPTAIQAQAIPLVLADPAIGFAFTLMGVPTTQDETLALRSSSEKIADWICPSGVARSNFFNKAANSAWIDSRSTAGSARQAVQSNRKNWCKTAEPSRVRGTGG